MIGAIIGAAASLGSMVAGGIGSAKENRKRNQLLQAERDRINNEYNQDYYADYMNRSDVQSLISKLREMQKTKNQNVQSAAAITGATPEAVTAEKQSNNTALENAAGNIAANADSYKQGIRDRYNAQLSGINNQYYANSQARTQNYQNMIRNGISGLAGAVGTGVDQLTSSANTANAAIAANKLAAPPIPKLNVTTPKIPTKFGAL